MSEVASLINKALASEDYVEVLRPYPALLFALESAMYDYQHNSLLYDTSFARSEVGIPVSIEIADGDYDTMLNKVKAFFKIWEVREIQVQQEQQQEGEIKIL